MIISITSLPDEFDWLFCKGILFVKETLPLKRRLEIIAEHVGAGE
jgi:hypothetical protein